MIGLSRLRLPSLLLATALGCAHAPEGEGIRLSGAIAFEDHDGQLAFRIEPAGEAIRVEDAGGKALAVLRLRRDGLAIADAAGQLAGVVLPPSGEGRELRIVSPGERSVLFALRYEPDGDLRVVDAAERLVCEAKRRDYGFKVVDSEGRLETKVRIRPDKVSLRNSAGVTFLSTRDAIPPASAAALAFESLRFELAAGLSVALAHWGVGAN